jgi:hypothetical protein
MNPEVKLLINKVAKDMGLNVIDVERAYFAPFELQSIIMKYRCDRDKQIFPSLRIPYFLIFFCPEWQKKRLKLIEKRRESIRSDQQSSDHI